MADVDLRKAINRAIVCIIIMVLIPILMPLMLNINIEKECLYIEKFEGNPCLRTELEIYFENRASGVEPYDRSYIVGDSFYERNSNVWKIVNAEIKNHNIKNSVTDVCREEHPLERISIFDIPKSRIYTGTGLCNDPTLKNISQQNSIPRYAFDSSVENIGWKVFMIKLMVFGMFVILCIGPGRLFLLYYIKP